MNAATTTELEPRKKVRLRLRADLAITLHKYQGRAYFIVKDPVSLRYYRYTEQENFLLRHMDGSHTLEQIRAEFEKHFRPDRLDLRDLEGFAQQLLVIGLAHNEAPQADLHLFSRRKEQRFAQWLQIFTNVLYVKVPLFDPDRLLAQLLGPLQWIFSTGFMLSSAAGILAAVLLVASHFEAFRDKLPSASEFFHFQTIFYLWLAYGVAKIIHEFGHGLTCKAFGGEVHEMGVLFLCLAPCLYCNVSDAWVLPDKWKRIVISFAGIYVELIIAALATFVWWNTPAQPFLNSACLYLMIVCSLSTVIFNGNPLLRYDGYYMLADWLEVPNLRSKAARFLKFLVQEKCLGMKIPPQPAMALWRQFLFVVYVVASYLYGWIMTFAILWLLYSFLGPYKLGAVSGLLACGAGASMIGWPLYRLGKSLHQRGRLPDMKLLRVVLSAGAILAALAFILFVPLPVSRVYQLALVQLQPDAVEKVFVQTPGILERLYVHDGQRVDQGDILAEFHSLAVDNQLEEARSEHDIRLVQVSALRDQAMRLTNPVEQAKVEVALAAAAGECNLYARQAKVYEKMQKRLVLRAPQAGVVMGAPHIDEIGKLWEKDQARPFCTIGDPTRLQALMPVSPDDYRLLKEDLAQQDDLRVTIRVQGLGAHIWPGRLARLPESEAKQVPFELTLKGGGPLAVKPGSPGGVYMPQKQQYLLGIDFLETDRAICPGTMAQVLVHCRWRTCAWWLWRLIASTFDLKLL